MALFFMLRDEKVGVFVFDSVKNKIGVIGDGFFKSLDQLTLDEAFDKAIHWQKLCWIAPTIGAFLEIIMLFFPFNTLNHQFLTWLLFLLLFANLICIILVNNFVKDLITSRPNEYAEDRLNDIKQVLKTRNIQMVLNEGVLMMLPISLTIIPYYEFLRVHSTSKTWTLVMTDALNGNDFLLKMLIFAVPIILVYSLYHVQQDNVAIFQDQIDKSLSEAEYHNPRLKNMLSGQSHEQQRKANHIPNLILGNSVETKDIIWQSVKTRRQNMIGIGPIGAGKSKTFFINAILQDCYKYLQFIRDYPHLIRTPGFMTKKRNIANEYLNGFAVIDTTNDLCGDVNKVTELLGIPRSKVYWLDPSNPHTQGFNMMRGPMAQVAEDLTSILAGSAKSNEDFFTEAGRNHLKNYVYLLKMTSILDNEIPTLTLLIEMYNNIYIVVDRMEKLEAYLQILRRQLNQQKIKYNKKPHDPDARGDYLEMQDKYNIAVATNQWFKNNIQKVTDNFGRVQKIESGPNAGKPQYYDVNTTYIKGLTDLLDDVSKNQGLRRVLFRDSGDFNLDDVMYSGGILLCNTAKSFIGPKLGQTIGEIYTNTLQAAIIRRDPDCVPLFPIYMDEFPDYSSEGFSKFAAQARKYSCALTLGVQSPEQLSYRFGDKWREIILDVMLTIVCFGNLAPDSAKEMSAFYGTHIETTRGMSDQPVQLTGGLESNRRMVSSQRREVPNITPEELEGMEKFTIAVRCPNPKGIRAPIMFNKVRTKFLNDEMIRNNPNNFDMNNSSDANSYAVMMKHQRHSNPDFDAVDSAIHQAYLDGKYTINIGEEGDVDVIFNEQNQPTNQETQNTINSLVGDSEQEKSLNEMKQEKDVTLETAQEMPHMTGNFESYGNISGDDQTNHASAVNGSNDYSNDDNSSSVGNNPILGDALVGEGEGAEVDDGVDMSNLGNESFASMLSETSDANAKGQQEQGDSSAAAETPNELEPTKDDEPQNSQLKVSDKEQAMKVVKKVVQPDGNHHGGNDRTKRSIHTSKEAPKIPLVGNKEGLRLSETKQTEKDLNAEEKENQVPETKVGEQKMMYRDKNGKLIVDQKDYQARERAFETSRTPDIGKSRQKIRDGIMAQIRRIESDQSIDGNHKIDLLRQMKAQDGEKFALLGPGGKNQILGVIDTRIGEIRNKMANSPIVFSGKDTPDSIHRKLHSLKDNPDLFSQMKDMLNSTPDPGEDVDLSENPYYKNAEADPNFDGSTDVFNDQHGMDGE